MCRSCKLATQCHQFCQNSFLCILFRSLANLHHILVYYGNSEQISADLVFVSVLRLLFLEHLLVYLPAPQEALVYTICQTFSSLGLPAMFTNCFMGKAIDRDIITSSKRLVHKHLKRYTQKYTEAQGQWQAIVREIIMSWCSEASQVDMLEHLHLTSHNYCTNYSLLTPGAWYTRIHCNTFLK